jgi:hypothetical protein
MGKKNLLLHNAQTSVLRVLLEIVKVRSEIIGFLNPRLKK